METARHFMDRYLEWQKAGADPRMDNLPLMRDPVATIAIIILYLIMVYWGPRLMLNRKPFSLRGFTKYYNLGQIIFCTYYVVSVYLMTEVEPDGLYLMCKKCSPSSNPHAEAMAFHHYLNYVCRIIELSETVVHILRKKNRQLSFLHVNHHTMNVGLAWMTARFQPWGTASTVCLLNFAVHLIMYSYYYASSHGSPTLQRISQSCKKYLTIIQMMQFLYIILLIIQDYSAVAACRCKTMITFLGMGVVVINLALFTNFYRKTYSHKTKKDK